MTSDNQKPTFSKIGDYAYSNGKAVAEMFIEDGGATFYPSQEEELILMLARNDDGSPAALTIGISIPRQNGKSYSARYYAIYMADFEHRSVLYSAHHSSTTKKMFDAMCSIFENEERYPEFAHDVKSITRGRGYEGIYFRDYQDDDGNWHDGGCIEFATRTNAGARGGTYSVIIIDESQELTDDQQEGMLPVISASSDISNKALMPQQILIGTPPGPSCNGTVFKRMHKAAHNNEGEGWWLEWGITDIKEVTPETVVDLAHRTNPAMGYRIAEKTILNEFSQMSVDGFCRERLGWWAPTVSQQIDYAIESDKWDRCKSDEPKPEGKTAYGVKFSADGSWVCLCGAVIPTNGKARISLIEAKPTGYGTGWLAEWLNERSSKACCVVIDGKNGVDVLVEKISDKWRMKGSVIRPGARDVIASVGMLVDAINEESVTWFSGQEALRESAITATKRPIGGGWGFGGENSAAIEGCALAFWGAKISKRDPNKKMLIG